VTIVEPPAANTARVPTSGRIETLKRLVALRDRGAITNGEHQAEKTQVMNDVT
jgi:hypothetical protein